MKLCPLMKYAECRSECAWYDTIKKQCLVWNLLEEKTMLTIAVENLSEEISILGIINKNKKEE